MKVRVIALSVALLAVTLIASAPTADAQAGGFRVSGPQLLDANGNPFIIRGINHPHVWYPGETASFAEIAGLGANTVRVVLGSGHQWGPSTATDVANVVSLCKQHALICMLEVHDATGFGESASAVSINQVVQDYWADPELLAVLEGEEAYVLINIANEPRGNTGAEAWVNETITAIQDMRAAGYDHTLVVDAPNWGQDWQTPPVMQSNAPQVATADPQDNVLFSVHMYEVYGNPTAINNYFDGFQQRGLPLIVGEFGPTHNGQDVDEDTILAEAVERGIGYIGWSYSGNSGGTELLDMTTNFDPDRLTAWGERVVNGPNGIAATAQCATVYPDC